MIVKEGRIGTWDPDKKVSTLLEELQSLVGRRGRYRKFRGRSALNVVEAIEITSEGVKLLTHEIWKPRRKHKKDPKHFEFEVEPKSKPPKSPKSSKQIKLDKKFWERDQAIRPPQSAVDTDFNINE